MANATAQLIRLQSPLKEFGVYQSRPQVLWCDNLEATYLTTNLVFHACTKQIEVVFHFVQERVAMKMLDVRFISSADQLAYIFTKPLAQQPFDHINHNLNLMVTS